jgi:hypothetical protein
MSTTALLRRNAVSSIRRIASTEPLLPFLYNTRTIRCEHTDALSEFENTSDSTNDRQRKPRSRSDRDGSRPTFRGSDRGAGGGYDRTNRARRTENPRFSRHDNTEEGSETFTPTSRTQYRRPMREDDIPFEHAAQETISIRDKIITSTMTPSEKKAFEGLLSLSQNKPVKDKGRHRDRPDKQEEVLTKASARRQRTLEAAPTAPPMPEALKKMQDKLNEDRSSAERVLLEQAVEQDLMQVKTILATAGSDVELWKMMHDIILSRLAPLDLENPEMQARNRERSRCYNEEVAMARQHLRRPRHHANPPPTPQRMRAHPLLRLPRLTPPHLSPPIPQIPRSRNLRPRSLNTPLQPAHARPFPIAHEPPPNRAHARRNGQRGVRVRRQNARPGHYDPKARQFGASRDLWCGFGGALERRKV